VNVVVKPAGREIVGMPETVTRLSSVLGDKSRRRVAIIADSNCAMARLHPAAELVLHDVAVHTGFGVVSHVGIASRIDEGESAHTYSQTNHHTQNNARR